MFLKKIKFIIVILILYQTPLYSKSTSFNDFNSKDLSKYFSGTVAFKNKDNSLALNFFDSSKILLNKHDPYLKKYIYSLVLENKVKKAISIIKNNKGKNNINFFDAHILLLLDALKKNDLNTARQGIGSAGTDNTSALAAGGNQWRRQQFEPLLFETSLISPCYAWRDKKIDESEEEYGERIANELEIEILRLGKNNVMAFLAEPVVGATAGALCPVPGYFAKLREICDKYGVLLIFDEVMCGMGRTGTLFACDFDGVIPDIITIAKGLGAGYQPIGAMICKDFIHDAIEKGSGFFQHGHTYLAHPIAAAAGNAVLDRLVNDGLAEVVSEKGLLLKQKLTSALGQHPHVGDIRGRGLFIGLELVQDRADKKPFDPSLKIANNIKKNAFNEGLACYPGQGTIDGKKGDHILIAPPFIITDDEMDLLVQRLKLGIDKSIY